MMINYKFPLAFDYYYVSLKSQLTIAVRYLMQEPFEDHIDPFQISSWDSRITADKINQCNFKISKALFLFVLPNDSTNSNLNVLLILS